MIEMLITNKPVEFSMKITEFAKCIKRMTNEGNRHHSVMKGF
jgi:hypothetical protein